MILAAHLWVYISKTRFAVGGFVPSNTGKHCGKQAWLSAMSKKPKLGNRAASVELRRQSGLPTTDTGL